jgi:hypothetical protein
MPESMTTFLFWNVQNKRLDGHLVSLVRHHQVDVLLLIEHPKPDDLLFSQLNTIRPFQRAITHNRFGVYVSFDRALMMRITPPTQNDRVDYWDVRVNKKNRLLLVLVHGLDIIKHTQARRSLFFERLHEQIGFIESELGHKQTIVLGDFNANPFDAIVGGVLGLHAIRVREVGGKHTRSVMNQDYEFFAIRCGLASGGGKSRRLERIITTAPTFTRSSGTCWTRWSCDPRRCICSRRGTCEC